MDILKRYVITISGLRLLPKAMKKIVQNLVEKQGFLRKINMKMPRVLGGMTALHVALRFGREEVTVYLVWRCRVKLEPLDAFNRTPIMVAREEKGESDEAIERQRASIMVVRTAMKEFDKARYLEMLKQEAEVEEGCEKKKLKGKVFKNGLSCIIAIAEVFSYF